MKFRYQFRKSKFCIYLCEFPPENLESLQTYLTPIVSKLGYSDVLSFLKQNLELLDKTMNFGSSVSIFTIFEVMKC